jgi:hypothetical protein
MKNKLLQQASEKEPQRVYRYDAFDHSHYDIFNGWSWQLIKGRIPVRVEVLDGTDQAEVLRLMDLIVQDMRFGRDGRFTFRSGDEVSSVWDDSDLG